MLIRVSSKVAAADTAEIYRAETTLRVLAAHSGLSMRRVLSIENMLRSGDLDGVVCVDMFGEGYDFPQLKIAVCIPRISRSFQRYNLSGVLRERPVSKQVTPPFLLRVMTLLRKVGVYTTTAWIGTLFWPLLPTETNCLRCRDKKHSNHMRIWLAPPPTTTV